MNVMPPIIIPKDVNLSSKELTLIGIGFIVLMIFIYIKVADKNDFEVFLDASVKLMKRENIYQPPFMYDLQYFYSPLFALILIPFTYLPFKFSCVLWLIFNTLLLIRTWKIFESYFDIQSFRKRTYYLWIAISFIIVARFIFYNYERVQMTIFLLWAIMEAIKQFNLGKNWKGAILLALAINIKILPLVMLPYLVYRGEFKASLYTLVALVGCLFIPALFFGWEYNLFLHKEWWSIINPNNPMHIIENEQGAHGLAAALSVLLTNTDADIQLPFQRNLFSLEYQQVYWIINGVRILLILLTLLFLRTLPFRKATSKIHFFYELSYLCLLIPIIFPHQRRYSFYFVFPAITYLIYFLLTYYHQYIKTFKTYRTGIAIFMSILVVLFLAIMRRQVLGDLLTDFTIYLRMITWGAIFLIPVLIIADYKHLINRPPKISSTLLDKNFIIKKES
jgi:hypothetical protein